ncbi:MAG TPA: hypothetical protein VNO30_28070 [Kofleriaceae bacterium]|nr:hypothetical protein [Kofleriaceae bacterium]
MTRLMIALAACALTAACPGGKPQGTAGTSGTSGTSNTGAVVLPRKLLLSWGITQEGELADIYLATTDETGKQVSHPLGRYKGTCSRITPAKEMNALTGVACVTGGGGTELHAVRRADEIVVVQLGTTPGVAPDPMAREEIKSVKIPIGVGVDVAP